MPTGQGFPEMKYHLKLCPLPAYPALVGWTLAGLQNPGVLFGPRSSPEYYPFLFSK